MYFVLISCRQDEHRDAWRRLMLSGNSDEELTRVSEIIASKVVASVKTQIDEYMLSLYGALTQAAAPPPKETSQKRSSQRVSMKRIEELILNTYDSSAKPCRHISTSEVLEEIGIGRKINVAFVRRTSALLRKTYARSERLGVAQYHMPLKRKDEDCF